MTPSAPAPNKLRAYATGVLRAEGEAIHDAEREKMDDFVAALLTLPQSPPRPAAVRCPIKTITINILLHYHHP
jgi:hypothetical protein